MQVRCPHCLVPFESIEGLSWTDLLCPSCGERFFAESEESTCTYRSGARVLGRFELLEEVGVGRFGCVWKARDTQLQRTVAVKIPRQRELDAQETEIFLRDARAAAQLNHPRIASVHEVGRENDTVYIVTDFIDGANLGQWLTGRKLSTVEAAELVIKISEALHHAHEMGVVHRDLKPGNIMLDRDGEPHVIDFGLARREMGEATITVDGVVMGTPAYMSPEQARGEGHRADRRSDIYSLGVVLYRLLTGELPFRGEARMLILQALDEEPPCPRKLNANVPRDLETITLKCLEKDRAKRYQTAVELAEDLQRHLSGEPIKARPVGHVERVWRWCKRHREVAALSGVLLLMLVAIATIAPIVAVHEARLRRESELRRIDLQNQVARNLFDRANEEYNAGRADKGIALLSAAYEEAAGSDDTLRGSIRGLMSGWSAQAGRPIVQDYVVLAAALSPDGQSALIGGHDRKGAARLWDLRTATPFGEPLQHTNSVRAAVFSLDGKLALTGSQDGTAQLWDSHTGLPAGKPWKQMGEIWAVAFSPDGNSAITGGKDKTARLWDSRTGEPMGEPLQHNHLVTSAAFSPDGSQVLTGCFDGTAQLWGVQSRQPVGAPIRAGKVPIYAVAFSPDGSKIVTCGGYGDSNNAARLWDARTLEPIGEPIPHENVVYAAAFSADGSRLLTGCFDNTARIWDAQTLKEIGDPLRHGGYVMSVAFSPDGRSVLTGSADHMVRFWVIDESKTLRHDGKIYAAAFSPQGDLVLTGGADKTARLWDARSGRPLGDPMLHEGGVLAVGFSPDGRTAITGSDDHRVRLWNVQTTKPNAEAWEVGGEVEEIKVSPDGKSALVRCKNQTVQLWELLTGKPLASPVRYDVPDAVLASSRDCHSVLIREPGGTAQMWDMLTAKAKGNPIRHNVKIMDAAFSGNGRTVLTAGYDQEVGLWDTETGRPIGEPIRHDGIVNTVTLGADGSTILSGSSDQTARLWDIQSGMSVGQPLQHAGEVLKVVLSPNGRLALTVCSDGSARLWDVPSCKLMTRPMQHEIGVESGTFNADGTIVLLRCADGTTRLYDIPQPLPDNPKFVRAWARTQSGFQLDEKNVLRQLSQAEWLKSQAELVALQEHPSFATSGN